MHEVVNPKSACGCLQEVFVYSCTRGRFQLTGKVLEFWIGVCRLWELVTYNVSEVSHPQYCYTIEFLDVKSTCMCVTKLNITRTIINKVI